ncbi:uncharacterized protein BCR38DRAFT_444835 [Pseudomassariella vexata]|uniref:Uncharacterized protein n=1 Tax=Pseudomassariella vexata TaxID=1141098 RepID=A0A1Y2DJW3_9PEZI|nr:uncharacterized protein BCR38DRAFT_444835 [Pseudomassariella vexata]ORY59537.1 hypothetical protein BCR38DRAFT_444835 [Pseudomassariella vexata]
MHLFQVLSHNIWISLNHTLTEKALVNDEQACKNFDIEADTDYCYAEFQLYYDYEHHLSNGDFTL